jgi:GT2 family glycosyltransferase
MKAAARIGVVVATRDRREHLLGALTRLEALPDRPPIVVVDNGSTDGTSAAVRRRHPQVRVIPLGRNAGAGARTIGVTALRTPYAAFADDDSWWAPGALERIADLFDAHPRLGLVAARVLVGTQQRLDPACAAMAASPLPAEDDLPGPPVLGFVACGAAVRHDAFLRAGGFDARFGIGGEEEPLALALAADGWGLAYVGDAVAHHHPDAAGARPGRRMRQARNGTWTLWLRRPARRALAGTLAALVSGDREQRRGLLAATRGMPWVLRERRVIPARVEHALRLLEAGASADAPSSPGPQPPGPPRSR